MSDNEKKPESKKPPQTLSLSGLNSLRRHEGSKDYYDDIAGNCTKGVGVLVHKGHCTAEELRQVISVSERKKSFESAIEVATREVRERTKKRELSQAQFDALVSFTYNVGNGGARKVLIDVNAGSLRSAANRMLQYDKYTPVDKTGRPLKNKDGTDIKKSSRGLALRRLAESRALLEKPLPPPASMEKVGGGER